MILLALFCVFVAFAAAQPFSCNDSLVPAGVAYYYTVCAADVGTLSEPGCAVLSGITNGATLVQFNTLATAASIPFSFDYTQSPALLYVCGYTEEEASVFIAQQVMRAAFQNVNTCGFGKVRDPATGDCQNENGSGTSNSTRDITITLLVIGDIILLVGVIIRGTFVERWLKMIFSGEVKLYTS